MSCLILLLASVVIGELKVEHDKQEQKSVRFRKPIKNLNQFKKDLVMQPWEELIYYEDPEKQLELFYEYYNKVLDLHSPFQTKKLRKNKKCPLSNETRAAMRLRDKIKAEMYPLSGPEKHVKFQQYKKERNRVISLIRRDEKENFKKLVTENGPSNPWKPVNSLLKKEKEHTISLLDGTTLINSAREKAELLNRTFISKVENIKKNIKADGKDPNQMLKLQMQTKKQKGFTFKTVSEKVVKKYIKRLKNTQSTGVDGMKTDMLKSCMDELVVPLTLIINTSLISGKYPSLLKMAVITPLFKKGSKAQPESYRPIAGLNTISKLLEAIAHDQIRQYFELHDYLPSSQHGYKKGRSTMSAVLQLTNNLSEKDKISFTQVSH